MSNLNKVFMMGHLTADVTLQQVNKTSLAKFTIATNRSGKTSEGKEIQETCFLDAEAWGKQAEVASMYFKKGSPILVEGRLKFAQWQDKNTGASRSKHVLFCESISIPGKEEELSEEFAAPTSTPAVNSPVARQAPVAAVQSRSAAPQTYNTQQRNYANPPINRQAVKQPARTKPVEEIDELPF